jgi:pyridoxamine 5'-phosphate oxidase-like protein
MAEFGRALLYRLGDGIGFLATLRAADGGPRVHPVCVTTAEGRLYLSIPRRSPKSADLRSDARFMLHAFPADEDAEFSIRGSVRLVSGAEREAVAAAATFATGVRDDEDVFALDIERADSTTWENWNTAQTRPARRTWIAR